jgi:hypothetical protein
MAQKPNRSFRFDSQFYDDLRRLSDWYESNDNAVMELLVDEAVKRLKLSGVDVRRLKDESCLTTPEGKN